MLFLDEVMEVADVVEGEEYASEHLSRPEQMM